MLDYTLERPRPMSSWLIDFSAKKEPLTIKSISYVTTGPHKIAIKVDAEINSSKISVIYEMEENTPLITINIKGIWLEVGNENIGCPSLRMPFPLNLESPKAFYEIPFGSIERDLNNDEEVPALQWAKVTGNKNQKTIGCLLLNDCKYGHALDDNILRISLIRSAYNPDPTPEVGEHEINLAILPFSGNLSNAKCTELGQRFNRKLKAIGTSVHKGDLPTKEQLIKISGANVVVSGLKKAENEKAVILRLYEMEGKTAKIDITFSKIFGIPRHAVIVDFMERELKSAPQVNIKSNGVVIDIAANSIFSLMIYFA
jgi:alpha-mannosidase